LCCEGDKAVERRIGNEPTKRKMMSHGSNICYESKRRNRRGMESLPIIHLVWVPGGERKERITRIAAS
jgi:hypothetical protein